MSAWTDYLRIAGIAGDIQQATVTWEWVWEPKITGMPGPNIVPLDTHVTVTNQAINGLGYVLPHPGTLTLTPTLTCDDESDVLELDPIVLTVGLAFSEPVPPCGICTPNIIGVQWSTGGTVVTGYVRNGGT
jgi:hypothetical protein